MRRGDALELFLSGERITAERAGVVGLVNHVVPREVTHEEVAGGVDSVGRIRKK